MRSSFSRLVAFLLLGASLSLAASPNSERAYKTKEQISAPRGWIKHTEAPADRRISLQEVEALVAPHPNSLSADLVRSSAKDWVILNIPVSLAEKMLNTYHAKSGDELVRTTSYSLPSNLHEHVDVFGRKFDSNVDASCNTTIAISCLRQLYNAVGYVPSNTSNNSIGITGYLEQFANLEDLQSFFADQVPAALNSSFKFESVLGGLNDQNTSLAGAEANLDVQFAFGISHPIPATFFSTAGRPSFNPDAHSLTTKMKNPPYTISTSYGDDEQTVPKEYAKRVCAGFAQLGARGVSVLFSSGDAGVGDGDADPETQECITNDGTNSTRFIPVFPHRACPHVTSVGGTTNIPELSQIVRNACISDFRCFKYLKTLPNGTYEGLYNRNPDVSAQADHYRFFYKAAAPAFAGFVALLNDARIKAGKGPLGFLNPLLYTFGLHGLNDITSGNNAGCGTTGFNVMTGLGTPNFNRLKQIVTSPLVF
ncbi:subtilisin-like protein [Pholiota molesta]|nr:subtilisin-like protein [Pholiota molesta]